MRLVDWGLAQRLALAVAGDGPRWRGTEEELRAESQRAAQLVRRYTGLRHRGPLPAAELVDREEWARANLDSFREMSGEVERTLAQRLQKSGGSAASGGPSPGRPRGPRSASPSATSPRRSWASTTSP